MKVLDRINAVADNFMDAFRIHDTSPSEMVTSADLKAQYQRPTSFTDKLPFIEYLPSEEMFLKHDCFSVAAGFEIKTINTEGFPLKTKAAFRDQLMRVLRDNVPQEADNPWVVEVFFSNTYSLDKVADSFVNFSSKSTIRDAVKESLDQIYSRHLKGVAGEKGIFVDEQVTKLPFGGKETVGRMFLYRRRNRKQLLDETPVDELNIVRDRLVQSIKDIGDGVTITNMTGENYYEWMFRWFNPNPDITEGDVDKALKMFSYPGDENVPVGRDFSGMLTLTPPKSDVDKGIWEFDGVKHKYMPVNVIRGAPKIGAFSAPTEGVSLFDKLPAGTTFAMKITFIDKDSVETDISRIEKSAIGDGAVAQEAREEAAHVKEILLKGGTLLPVEMGFYVRAKHDNGLRRVCNKIKGAAADVQLQVLDDKYDLKACDNYFRMMPGNYRPDLNKTRSSTVKCSLEHVANYFPLLGRGVGSGTCVQMQFNRGGEVMAFDTIGDRLSNSHKVIIGGSGAGKSVKLVEELFEYVAQYNAQVFIIEKGDSFNLAVEYLERLGKSTNQIKLDSKSKTVLPPYANAYRALDAEDDFEEAINNPRDVFKDTYAEIAAMADPSVPPPDDLEQFGVDADDEDKDYLGEMELMTRIIVTGGNAAENAKLKPADQSFIRRAILNAARKCLAHCEFVSVSDTNQLVSKSGTAIKNKEGECYWLDSENNTVIIGKNKESAAPSVKLLANKNGIQLSVNKFKGDNGHLTDYKGNMVLFLTKPHPLISDVALEMKQLMEDDKFMREEQKSRVYEFGEGMNNFTMGLAGKLFNKHGLLFPDVDITHIDMGDTVKAGKEAELAVAYASVLNSVTDLAEANQYSGRPILVITDEGHNFVSKTSKASEILVPAIVKIVKMMRKLGCWYWIATQNIKDFSDEAAALLKLAEWWEVLLVPEGEDEDIARFKRLSDDQRAILSSVTKEPRKYTEGFIMCANKKINNQIFRNIPPSIILALAMSDPDEKRARASIMKQHNVSELDAALIMADELDQARGFAMVS